MLHNLQAFIECLCVPGWGEVLEIRTQLQERFPTLQILIVINGNNDQHLLSTYLGPSILRISSHLSGTCSCEGGAVSIPTSQIRNVRLGEVK